MRENFLKKGSDGVDLKILVSLNTKNEGKRL